MITVEFPNDAPSVKLTPREIWELRQDAAFIDLYSQKDPLIIGGYRGVKIYLKNEQ